jgi:hypothetical protein
MRSMRGIEKKTVGRQRQATESSTRRAPRPSATVSRGGSTAARRSREANVTSWSTSWAICGRHRLRHLPHHGLDETSTVRSLGTPIKWTVGEMQVPIRLAGLIEKDTKLKRRGMEMERLRGDPERTGNS